LTEAAGVILGGSSQSRLSFVAGGLRRNTGVERKIRPDSHKNSWKGIMSIPVVLVQAA